MVSFTRTLRLLKLHGSIDWQAKRREPTANEDAFLPFEGVERVTGQTPKKPALIFGAGNKLRAGGPCLELLRQFEESLNRSEALLVVGYSFCFQPWHNVLAKVVNIGWLVRIAALPSFEISPPR
jgi:hypothetical protein